ncbi:MAG: efflux RND transporter permease subunit [bacterium]
MIDSILVWSLRNRLSVLAMAAFVLVYGIWEASKAPIDVFPDLTAPTVTVLAEAHGMAPQDIEQSITFPIESALNGASGVRRVRSSTSEGLSIVNVDFEWDVDVHVARQVVAERLQTVSQSLPREAEPPIIGPMTSVMGDILFIGLTGEESIDLMNLRTTAEWNIARRLRAVPGVAQVITIGGEERQYQVELDPRRLDAYDLTAEDVAQALERANENMPAGFLVEGGTEHQLIGVGRVENLGDIAGSLVALRDGLPIRVSDVADVGIGPGLKRGEGGINGQRGVLIGIRKQPNVNTIEQTKEIERLVEDLGRGLPPGMTLHPSLFRQADFIDVSVSNVTEALRDGSLLVILIVLLFLASGRATLITALAIPLSLLVAVLALRLQDVTINTMTLGGMAIAVGALVDDAIIDVENVVRRLREWAARPAPKPTAVSVVLEASREIRRSIVFATFIIVLVFLPLFFLDGVEGRMLRPLGFAYVVSLAASLLVALTVTPVLCSLMLPTSRAVAHDRESRVVQTVKRWFEPILSATLPRWKMLTGISTVLFVAAIVGFVSAGRAFLPAFNEGALTISVMTPPGTSLTESEKVGIRVEQILLTHPEVVSTARRTGRAPNDDHAQPVHSSEVEAQLRRTERPRGFSSKRYAPIRRAERRGHHHWATAGTPHRTHHLGQSRDDRGEGFWPRPRHHGDHCTSDRGAAKQINGTADVALEQQTLVPFVSVRFDRRNLARYGLTVHHVADEVATALQGRVVSQVFEGSAAYDLVVMYKRDALDSLDGVREKRIGTPTGARIPLHAVAAIERTAGPSSIGRENGRRKIVVVGNVAGRDVGSVVGDIRTRLTTLKLPEGVHVELDGQFERRGRVEAACVARRVCVGHHRVAADRCAGSMRDAVLVLVNLPLSLIGGVVGVYLAGGTVSIASLIGFITLFGVATRNGIMMVTHIQHLHRVDGLTQAQAVHLGALERLAPILMTALASGLGLLPLALALGEPGSEIQAPMAMVILCGLGTSTALNMVVIPALYARFGSFGQPTEA